ncbi:MAG TPA: maleylacetoacetate isomerase [Pseudorhodoplanes sp.]|nr:maleylacetoacetate isomerase [Pseudorhodoplanes sp.]
MKLYNYFRSSAAYRVRIALALKDIPYEFAFVHLVKDGGHHKRPDYKAVNPQMRVPALVLSSGETLVQSMAIVEYLDEVYPDPPLLPAEDIERVRVRAVAQIVACDIHPLNNSGTMAYLRKLGHDDAMINEWYAYWVTSGFEAIEAMIKPAPYAFGSHVTIADICLIPQIYNARRFEVPLDKFPKILGVEAACNKLPAFEKSKPENQPDAE